MCDIICLGLYSRCSGTGNCFSVNREFFLREQGKLGMLSSGISSRARTPRKPGTGRRKQVRGLQGQNTKTPGLDGTARPSEVLGHYEPVARLITPDPPRWLLEMLRGWAPAFQFEERMHALHPSRAEMRKKLREVERAARLIQKSLFTPDILLFLIESGGGFIKDHTLFDRMLANLAIRAMCAASSPLLATSYGKTKAGRGSALPPGTIHPRCFCSLVMAELWKHFHGIHPRPTNIKIAEAAEKIWELSCNIRRSWGSIRYNAWRPYFEDARSPAFDRVREGIVQMIHQHEAQARSATTVHEQKSESIR